ncbi:MAG: hypothetical protein IJJ66_10950 [Treponema sp.]|nr:hypothetical protein [Treponema sp.]
MKKVVRIFTMLSVLAIGGLLICCSGGGSSSDDDDAPAVSTTSTTTTATPTSYLARVMYTATAGEHMTGDCANEGYSLWRGSAGGYAILMIDRIIPEFISEDTTTTPATARFWLKAMSGYYLEVPGNNYAALVLPAGVIGSEIDPNTNCWVR